MAGMLPALASAATWEKQVAKFQPAATAPGDMAGTAVDIHEDLLVIGAPYSSSYGFQSGNAFVYQWSGSEWAYVTALSAPSTSDNDYFGMSVAINGDWIAVGAPGESGFDPESGAVHLFAVTDTGISYSQTVYDAQSGASHAFGWSLDMTASLLVAGAPYASNLGVSDGTATVFRLAGGVWSSDGWLESPSGTDQEYNGYSVALTESSTLGELVLLGAPGSSSNAGAVHTYYFDLAWLPGEQLVSGDQAVDHSYGYSVAVDGDLIAVGEPGNDTTFTDAGRAWLHTYIPGLEFVTLTYLEPAVLSADDRAGASVAVEGTAVVMGVPNGTALGANTGRIDVWDEDFAGNYVHDSAYYSSDTIGTAESDLGAAVGISRGIVLGGAPETDADRGAAYLFGNQRWWVAAGSGDWLDNGNWSGGHVPDDQSEIYFGLDDTFSVEVDGGNAEGISMLVYAGFVTIKDALGGGTLSLYPGGSGLTIGATSPGQLTSLLFSDLAVSIADETVIGGSAGGSAWLRLSGANGDFEAISVGTETDSGLLSLSLASSIISDDVVHVGADGGQVGLVSVSGGSSISLSNPLDVTNLLLNNGRLSIDSTSTISCDVGIAVDTLGEISGDGWITSPSLTNRGRVYSDTSGGGSLTIDGFYYQENESPTGEKENGLLVIEDLPLGGLGLSITDTAGLAGGCVVGLNAPDTLVSGDILDIVSSSTIDGDFSVWFVPAVGTDFYLDPYTLLRGVGDLSLEVKALGSSFGFNAETAASGGHASPVAMIVDDLDGDLVDDVAVVTSSPDAIDIWLNDGGGTLCLYDTVSLASPPADLAAADFDQDGDLDLVIVTPSDDQAVVYQNNGSGEFSLATSLATGDTPSGVAAFSLNGDNLPDIAVTNYNDDTISLFVNTSTLLPMGFGPQSVVATVEKPKPIGPGGLGTGSNKDDDLIVVGDTEGGAHENDGLALGVGAVTTFPLGGTPVDLAVIDVNDDGYDDVAVTLDGDDSLAVILNDPSGAFDPPVLNASGVGGGEIAAADIDDDGDDDLVLVEIDDLTGDESVIAVRNDSPVISRSGGRQGACPPGETADCNGNCAPANWVGDGYCDDGTYSWNGIPIFFNCDEFDCDGGDCKCAAASPVAMLAEETLTITRGIAAGTHIVGAGDIDADGATDVIQIRVTGGGYDFAVQTALDSGAWSPGACCEGDLDGSGDVDVDDLLTVISAWGVCVDPDDCPADIDGDGTVSVDDLLAVIAAFGPC